MSGNPGQSGNNNVDMGGLVIGHNACPWIGATPAVANEYYPWNSKSLNAAEQWNYDPIQGPVSKFSGIGFRQGGVVTVVEQ